MVTDRWQKFTEVTINLELMEELGSHCDEFLIHAVDVEGKARGVEKELVELLSKLKKRSVTYAGGVGSMEDLEVPWIFLEESCRLRSLFICYEMDVNEM